MRRRTMFSEWTSSRTRRSYHAEQAAEKKGGRRQIHFPHARSWQDWFILFCAAQWLSAALSHEAEPSGKSDRKCPAINISIENKGFWDETTLIIWEKYKWKVEWNYACKSSARTNFRFWKCFVLFFNLNFILSGKVPLRLKTSFPRKSWTRGRKTKLQTRFNLFFLSFLPSHCSHLSVQFVEIPL